MGQRVERYATTATGQAVAHAIGYVGVGELVRGDTDDEGGDQGSEDDEGGDNIVVQPLEVAEEEHSHLMIARSYG